MKLSFQTFTIKNTFLCLFSAFLILTTISCAKKVSFLTSPVVPAARGQVKIKKDSNKNYAIQMHIYNLAEVKRLQPPKDAYVIWLVTNDGRTKNIGQIKSSTATFSKKLKANFESVSSFKPNKIIITAEDEASVQFPGSMVILSTDNF